MDRFSRVLLESLVAGAGLAAVCAAPAHALVVQLDSFTVSKNGSVLFQDGFSDGVAPPSAPAEFASYLFTRGIGAESGGVLQLTTATAPIAANAVGSPTQTSRGTLNTNADNADPVFGLKSSSMTFGVTAVFDFVAPGSGETYGVRFVDRDPSTGNVSGLGGTFGDDFVQVQVVRNGVTNNVAVRLRTQDFPNNTLDNLEIIDLTPAQLVGVDQISVSLTRADPSTNVITASFALLSSGIPSFASSFSQTATIFSNENFTRPEFLASAPPIPEPEVYAMMGVGLGLVGWAARRRRRLS